MPMSRKPLVARSPEVLAQLCCRCNGNTNTLRFTKHLNGVELRISRISGISRINDVESHLTV